MNGRIRFAWVGLGPRAWDLLTCYLRHPQFDVVAVADRIAALGRDIAGNIARQKGHSVKSFADYEQMVRGSAFDALIVCLPPDEQVAVAVDAMQRGIHVMTEVPAAVTLAECWALVNAVKKTGVKYQLAEQTRHWHFIRRWREMAQAGELGKIYYAEGEYLHYEPKWDVLRDKRTGERICPQSEADYRNPEYEESWRYRLFKNPMYYTPHELSPLLSVTGGRICKVSCLSTPLGGMVDPFLRVRDMQAALMYTTEDVIFSLRAGFTTPHGGKGTLGAHWYQVKGTKACVETARSTLDTMKHYRADSGWEAVDWGTAHPDAPPEFCEVPHGGADFYPIATFIDAIANDTVPEMDVYHAVESAAPAILAVESAARGGALLSVPDFRI